MSFPSLQLLGIFSEDTSQNLGLAVCKLPPFHSHFRWSQNHTIEPDHRAGFAHRKGCSSLNTPSPGVQHNSRAARLHPPHFVSRDGILPQLARNEQHWPRRHQPATDLLRRMADANEGATAGSLAEWFLDPDACEAPGTYRPAGDTQSSSISTATERCKSVTESTRRGAFLVPINMPSAPQSGPRLITTRCPISK